MINWHGPSSWLQPKNNALPKSHHTLFLHRLQFTGSWRFDLTPKASNTTNKNSNSSLIAALVTGVPLEPLELEPEPEERGFIICNACDRLVKQIFTYFDQGTTNEQITDTIASVCTTFRLFDSSICRGFLETSLVRDTFTSSIDKNQFHPFTVIWLDFLKPTIRYIYENTEIIAGNVCGLVLTSENCSLSNPEKLEWTIKPSVLPKPLVADKSVAPVIQFLWWFLFLFKIYIMIIALYFLTKPSQASNPINYHNTDGNHVFVISWDPPR